MTKDRQVADLHIHTNASDGAYSVEEIARRARETGLEIIAITDHDSVSGLDGVGGGLGVEVIPGLELSAQLESREVHILGYFIDVAHGPLRARLEKLQQGRRDRLGGILEKLSRLDIHLDPDKVHELADCSSVGRLHVAEILIDRGHASTLHEAFRDFLGSGGRAYVPKAGLSVARAIELVHLGGGAAVLAHPGGFFDRRTISEFAEAGLDGIEVYYPSHSPINVRTLAEIVRDLRLVATGGSDFHGRSLHETPLGAVRVSREKVEILRERSAQYAAGRLP